MARKIIITTGEAHVVVDFMDISHCIADGAYTKIHFTNESSLLISKTLGVFFEELPNDYFKKVSRSAIVNVNHVVKVIRGKNKLIKVKSGVYIDYTIQVNEILNSLKTLIEREDFDY